MSISTPPQVETGGSKDYNVQNIIMNWNIDFSAQRYQKYWLYGKKLQVKVV